MINEDQGVKIIETDHGVEMIDTKYETCSIPSKSDVKIASYGCVQRYAKFPSRP